MSASLNLIPFSLVVSSQQDQDWDPHLCKKSDPDPHLCEKSDPDLHLCEKSDPDSHLCEKKDSVSTSL